MWLVFQQLLTLTFAAVAPAAADARDACRRAARALVDQNTRFDDARGARGQGGTLYWRADDGTQGICRVDRRDRVFEVKVERWGRGDDGIGVWPGSGVGESSRYLRCESERGRRKECSIPDRAAVTLVDRLSDSPCVQGRSWGVRRDRIWVDNGCRAVFEVRW